MGRLDKQLVEAHDPNKPFGTFIKWIEDVMEIVEAVGCPCTPSQIANKAFRTINKSKVHPEGCREWKRKPDIDKTWVNLKSHFSLEAKEYRK